MSHEELLRHLGTLSWRRAGLGAKSPTFRPCGCWGRNQGQLVWATYKEKKHDSQLERGGTSLRR